METTKGIGMESTSKDTRATSAVVIYHANCVDGFASAWAFKVLKEKDYPEGVEYIAKAYGEYCPDVIGNIDVYVLDFSFPREVITKLAEGCKGKVLVLDHHKTAQEIFAGWIDHPDNLSWVFDMERSGCGITWDHFADSRGYHGDEQTKPRPALIQYIEDRDLWRFALWQSKYVNAFINAQDTTFNDYSYASDRLSVNLTECVLIGTYLSDQHQKICEEICRDSRRTIISNGLGQSWKGLASNCTPQFRSEVGDLLAKQSGTYGATYHSTNDGSVKWSIRSIGDYDVSQIAKLFGGGGHKNASGFKVSLGQEGVKQDEIHLWTPFPAVPTPSQFDVLAGAAT